MDMSQGVGVRMRGMLESGGCRVEGEKGENKWDNCNSIINKIYFKNVKKGKRKRMACLPRAYE